MGEAFIDVLLENKLITSIADMYTLEDSQKKMILLANQGIGQKKYYELIEEIKKSKNTPLRRLVNGLGITHIGKKTAQIIIDAIGKQLAEKEQESFSIIELEKYLCDETFLQTIKGIGPEITSSVADWFRDDANKKILETMATYGVARNVFTTKHVIKGKLTGMRFVLTGNFALPRKVITDILKKHGALVTETMNHQVNYLLIGDDPSSKIAKAQQRNITCIE